VIIRDIVRALFPFPAHTAQACSCSIISYFDEFFEKKIVKLRLVALPVKDKGHGLQ
jgi:hypothetical protein